MAKDRNETAQQKLAQALALLRASNPERWYLQAVQVLGVFYEHVEHSVSKSDEDEPARTAGVALIRAINVFAIRYPSDWAPRMNRFALLADLKMKEVNLKALEEDVPF